MELTKPTGVDASREINVVIASVAKRSHRVDDPKTEDCFGASLLAMTQKNKSLILG